MHNSTLKGLLTIIAAATIFALSCDSENNIIAVADKPADYYPLSKGQFQVYEVEQVTYTLGIRSEETFMWKTVIADSILRSDGTYEYVQYSYKRAGDQDWQYSGTASIHATQTELVRNEQNTDYLKFRIPLTEGYKWNGNLYNNLGDDEYLLQGAHVNFQAGENSFHDCLVINQEDNQDFVVFLDQRTEIYARNVGLVSGVVRQLHYCTSTEEGCLGQQIVEEGVEYTQTLLTHGRE